MGGSSNAPFVPLISAKTTSLSTKLLVKFWKPRRTNAKYFAFQYIHTLSSAFHDGFFPTIFRAAIDMVSIRASVARLAIARIMSAAKASSTSAVNLCHAQNADSRLTRQRI